MQNGFQMVPQSQHFVATPAKRPHVYCSPQPMLKSQFFQGQMGPDYGYYTQQQPAPIQQQQQFAPWDTEDLYRSQWLPQRTPLRPGLYMHEQQPGSQRKELFETVTQPQQMVPMMDLTAHSQAPQFSNQHIYQAAVNEYGYTEPNFYLDASSAQQNADTYYQTGTGYQRTVEAESEETGVGAGLPDEDLLELFNRHVESTEEQNAPVSDIGESLSADSGLGGSESDPRQLYSAPQSQAPTSESQECVRLASSVDSGVFTSPGSCCSQQDMQPQHFAMPSFPQQICMVSGTRYPVNFNANNTNFDSSSPAIHSMLNASPQPRFLAQPHLDDLPCDASAS
ncbi:hypothetical protein Ciccas_000233 [Cichlidogyrus casuarinus]|uniref:Aryl hydrocarbon receptor nuclear translocator n=1 Tax=Cichlidogyrus casuarinus TaxID=1844966 RepID=A0ABD2QNF9_9PLAT